MLDTSTALGVRGMERINQLHRALAALNLGSGFAGLAIGSTPIGLNVILMTVLLLILRAKFWFDDEAYFEDVAAGKLPRGFSFAVGVIIAVGSWIVWTFAGFYIKDIEIASLLMVGVFVLSTFWIVAAMVVRGAYAEQVPWLFFNVLYACGFFLLFMRQRPWNPFQDRLEGYTTSILVVLVLLFAIDLGVTRILEARRRV